MPDQETFADMLEAAARVLDTDSPVHAPGRVRIFKNRSLVICDQHDDPGQPPSTLDRNGHCRDCVFVDFHRPDHAVLRQIAALINARESLQAWLTATAGYDTAKIANRVRRPTGHLASALEVARALTRSTDA
jgi:hypothetical protein